MDRDQLWALLEQAEQAIRRHDSRVPLVALVLGSGLGAYADTLAAATRIPYGDIPGFPVSTVSGHAGQLVIGEVGGRPVVAMQGRVHLYEGLDASAITLPLRTLWRLGATHLIITNAAGGINPSFQPGDLMVLTDHLNLTGQNPLVGPNDDRLGPRFPDLSQAYDLTLQRLAHDVALELGTSLRSGVYAGLLGPAYETPAEIRMLGTLGADTVGMSTVCEVIVARHVGMRVLGISCVTNLAAGMSDTPLSHDEVKVTATRVRGTFQSLVDGVVRRIVAGEASE